MNTGLKVTLSPQGKGKEILSTYDNKWYKRGVEYDIDFTTAVRLQQDPEFQVTFPYQHNEFDPKTWEQKEAVFVSDIDPMSGWGNVGTNLLKYSPKIKFAQVGRLWGVREPAVLAAARRDINPASGAVWHQQPKAEWLLTPFGRNIAITPFETTRVPASWVPRLNSMDAVFVPCVQNIEMMQNSGVTKPIELIHWGVDTTRFYPVKRNPNRPFTFGHMGALSVRKGTDILVRAFQAAFPHQTDVRLICKTSNRGYPFAVFNEPRIQVQMGPVEHQELMDKFFAQIDCFVYPTLGEGFGLTIPEAMATGVPAIATGWSGPVEYMREDVGWSIDYSLDKARNFDQHVYHEDCGDWAIPNFDHLVHLLRTAYDNQDLTRRKGAAAAEYIKEEWTWDKQIPLFHEALDRHLK